MQKFLGKIMNKKGVVFLIVGVFLVVFITLYIFFKSSFKKEKKEISSFQEIEGIISPGDSLWSILRSEGVSGRNAHNFLKNLRKVYDYKRKKIRPGEKYRVVFSTNGEIVKFEYIKSPLLSYVVKKTTWGYVSRKIKKKLKKYICGRRGIISGTLWHSMLKADIDPELILDFSEVFSWQIDFLTEPRNGDKFYIVWERYENEGIIRDGRIIVAKYEKRNGRSYTAIGFGDEGGWEFYDVKGRSMRKQFLKAPLHYRRISSYFSLRRFHPILKIYRPHRGIDYAAPYGTPVSSVADGVVIYAGWKGAAGKCVIIRHNSIYTTSYGHLSKIRRGIKKGVRVRQGDIIGYVGSTGLATGPHLDFRIKKRGKFVNFLKLKFPSAKRIPKSKRKDFETVKKRAFYFLGKLISEGSFKVEFENEKGKADFLN
ncbi:MAG: M23 family peptidase [Caldiserica bacterium]|nr:MAG: M23 family peptidase [Caldisericota bacterium]